MILITIIIIIMIMITLLVNGDWGNERQRRGGELSRVCFVLLRGSTWTRTRGMRCFGLQLNIGSNYNFKGKNGHEMSNPRHHTPLSLLPAQPPSPGRLPPALAGATLQKIAQLSRDKVLTVVFWGSISLWHASFSPCLLLPPFLPSEWLSGAQENWERRSPQH